MSFKEESVVWSKRAKQVIIKNNLPLAKRGQFTQQ